MRPQIMVAVGLLPALDGAAETPVAKDFAMEFVLPAEPRPAGHIVVQCLEGCDWREKTFWCPEGPKECRHLVASREDFETTPARRLEAQPLRVGGCMGISVIMNPPGRFVEKCEATNEPNRSGQTCHSEMLPDADSRVSVNQVTAGSPAERAWITSRDILVKLNGRPIRSPADSFAVTSRSKPGEPFDALIERDGAQMTLYGELGVRISDGTCAVATPDRLAAAIDPEQRPAPVPFKLAVRVPGTSLAWDCLEGCDAAGSYGCVPVPLMSPEECVFTFTQDNERFRSP